MVWEALAKLFGLKAFKDEMEAPGESFPEYCDPDATEGEGGAVGDQEAGMVFRGTPVFAIESWLPV